MSDKKPSLLDWLLYFGSKDERHRAAADRAGHLGFWVAMSAALVDFLLRVRPVHGDLAASFGPVAVDLVIILIGGGLYCWQWIAKGITMLDRKQQKQMLWTTIPLLGVACGLLGWFKGVSDFSGTWLVIASVGLGLSASLVAGLGILGLNRLARLRADAALDKVGPPPLD